MGCDWPAVAVEQRSACRSSDIATPVPVTLDGQTHTVTIALDEVAQTMSPGDTLTLQLVGSATAYENVASVGVIYVSDMQLALPTVATTSSEGQ